MSELIDHDQLFKQLIQTFFLDFLRLFAIDLYDCIDPESIQFLPQEYFTDILDGDRKAIDLLVQARIRQPQGSGQQEQMILVHIENQSTSQSEFDQRMFFYFAQLYREHRLPIYPLVVFSFDEPYRPESSQHRVTLANLDVLTFNFHPVQLNRLNWRDFLQDRNPVAAALMAKMKIQPGDRPRVKLECLRMLATLRLDPARTFLISGFVDTYLRLNVSEQAKFQEEIATIETVQEREEVMQITTSWMEEGLEQGLEQGRKGMEQMLRKYLAHKFGQLPTELVDRLQGLSIEQLGTLHDASFDFTSIDELTQWLDQN